MTASPKPGYARWRFHPVWAMWPLQRGGTLAATVGQVIAFAFAASFNPTLLAATTLMLLLDRPGRLMLGYLLGAYTVSITLGLVIVFSLSDSSAANTTQNTINPAIDIALGALALLVAYIVHSGHAARARERRRLRKAGKPQKEPRWRRELNKGSPRTTFTVGLLLTLPGASYLAGLSEIHKQKLSTTATVLAVVGFNAIMLWLLEVPLLGFLVAPDATPRAIDRSRAWVSRHAHTFAVRGASVIGLLLIAKGIVGLA